MTGCTSVSLSSTVGSDATAIGSETGATDSAADSARAIFDSSVALPRFPFTFARLEFRKLRFVPPLLLLDVLALGSQLRLPILRFERLGFHLTPGFAGLLFQSSPLFFQRATPRIEFGLSGSKLRGFRGLGGRSITTLRLPLPAFLLRRKPLRIRGRRAGRPAPRRGHRAFAGADFWASQAACCSSSAWRWASSSVCRAASSSDCLDCALQGFFELRLPLPPFIGQRDPRRTRLRREVAQVWPHAPRNARSPPPFRSRRRSAALRATGAGHPNSPAGPQVRRIDWSVNSRLLRVATPIADGHRPAQVPRSSTSARSSWSSASCGRGALGRRRLLGFPGGLLFFEGPALGIQVRLPNRKLFGLIGLRTQGFLALRLPLPPFIGQRRCSADSDFRAMPLRVLPRAPRNARSPPPFRTPRRSAALRVPGTGHPTPPVGPQVFRIARIAQVKASLRCDSHCRRSSASAIRADSTSTRSRSSSASCAAECSVTAAFSDSQAARCSSSARHWASNSACRAASSLDCLDCTLKASSRCDSHCCRSSANAGPRSFDFRAKPIEFGLVLAPPPPAIAAFCTVVDLQ